MSSLRTMCRVRGLFVAWQREHGGALQKSISMERHCPWLWGVLQLNAKHFKASTGCRKSGHQDRSQVHYIVSRGIKRWNRLLLMMTSRSLRSLSSDSGLHRCQSKSQRPNFLARSSFATPWRLPRLGIQSYPIWPTYNDFFPWRVVVMFCPCVLRYWFEAERAGCGGEWGTSVLWNSARDIQAAGALVAMQVTCT